MSLIISDVNCWNDKKEYFIGLVVQPDGTVFERWGDSEIEAMKFEDAEESAAMTKILVGVSGERFDPAKDKTNVLKMIEQIKKVREYLSRWNGNSIIDG